MIANLDVGRIVRALRMSSHPPKAGWPLPPELATRLIEGAGAALNAEAAPDRWVAVLNVLAFAPVRDKVIPVSLPKELHPDVRATIARMATRIPKIAGIYEIAPVRNAPRTKTERRRPKKAPAKKPAPGTPIADTTEADTPAPETSAPGTPIADTTEADTPAPETSAPGTPIADTTEADTPAPETSGSDTPVATVDE